MKCPSCLEKTGVELNTHAEGYVSNGDNLKDCNHCGAVWLKKTDGSVEMITQGAKSTATAA